MLNGGHEHPAVFSRKMDLAFAASMSDSDLKLKAAEFLSGLTWALRDGGCRFIGHIKGLIRAGRKDHLAFSVTSFDAAARIDGTMDSGASEAELSITIIVYGIGESDVERIFQTAFKKHFPGN